MPLANGAEHSSFLSVFSWDIRVTCPIVHSSAVAIFLAMEKRSIFLKNSWWGENSYFFWLK